ncbi:glucosamine-6-phosphate deaminase [Cytophagales bacterium WSM2-2]|nr:glucosamine-6-phosphate deaminase [Cytophagales bacterium WSM2-2]
MNNGTNLHINFEKIPTSIYPSADTASKSVAKEIAELIRAKQKEGKKAVLGLATGSSPKKVYAELIRMHKEEGLSFKNVISFNLDEYYPMQPTAPQSYHRFMKENLFDYVDIPKGQYFVPDGTIGMDNIKSFCERYEKQISETGGLDFQLLGIGRNGHIGFNEPGSHIESQTRLITLDFTTRSDAGLDFGGLANVPRKAITLGIKKIMQAKRIVLIAWGEHKSPIIRQAVEGPVAEHIPASYLQGHSNAQIVMDESCASALSRRKTPWLFDSVEWDKPMIKKAVTQLALAIGKSILMLTNEDYNENGLSELLARYGQAYEINIEVFNWVQHTITGWPGGKPNADDTHRPERAVPASKRVLIFSPHPDDDIISMGGTFQRLVDQGHEVHVAYQTSGNIAVADDEALRFIEFMRDFNQKFSLTNEPIDKLYYEANGFLQKKRTGEKDTDEVRAIKGLIRVSEAKNTCRFVGVAPENIHFLNMPFYETGAVQKKPLSEEDFSVVTELIRKIKPHQIYAAGDLADPHGTHKVCLDAVIEALKRLKGEPFMKDCWTWLYKGAWAEWDIDLIEMAVPMSPDQVMRKRIGVFKHQSQKDGVVYQGDDAREFWQRAEDRNRATAQIYNKLGLAEYAAMEAFVRLRL